MQGTRVFPAPTLAVALRRVLGRGEVGYGDLRFLASAAVADAGSRLWRVRARLGGRCMKRSNLPLLFCA